MKCFCAIVWIIVCLATTVLADEHTYNQFTLLTKGSVIEVKFNNQLIITQDNMDGVDTAAGTTWKVDNTTQRLVATLEWPSATKRIVLRNTDCFVVVRANDIRSNCHYSIAIPRSLFAGGRAYRCETNETAAVWVSPQFSGTWRSVHTLGVLRDGQRFEFQHSVRTHHKSKVRLDIPKDEDAICRWTTRLSGDADWTIYRFTADPNTPLPPGDEGAVLGEFGNLSRDYMDIADAGFAMSMTRSARAVFRGQPLDVHARYLDWDRSGRLIKYTYRIRDWREKVVSESKGQFYSGTTGASVHHLATLPSQRIGCFKFDLEATDGHATITRQTIYAVLPKPRWHGNSHDGFFGGHLGGSPTEPWRTQVATMSGVTWVRLHDTNGLPDFRWPENEPAPGQYVLKEPRHLRALKDANLNVLACMYHNDPKWVEQRATKLWQHTAPEIKLKYPGREKWYYYPELLELHKTYLRVLLQDRGHLIDAIEPQNEMYWQKDAIGQLNLVRATKEVVDEVAPHILVVGPTVPPGSYGSPWAQWCKEAGVDDYTDVVAGHFYVGRGIAALGSESVMEKWCLSLRSLYTRKNVSKPVWNTEWCTNFPTSFYSHPYHLANVYAPGNPALALDPHMYAVVNLRQFIAMAVHGVKSFWHVYYAGSSLDRRLLEYDWTPNPAGVAFSAATYMLDGASFIGHWNPVPDIRGYVVDTPRGAVAIVFGRRFLDGETAQLTFQSQIPNAQLFDTMMNEVGWIEAGTMVTIDNDPMYITVSSMTGSVLLDHLNEVIIDPPDRNSVIATFLFDEPIHKESVLEVRDETESYTFVPHGEEPRATLVTDIIDRGPVSSTFEYARNRCMYFPKETKTLYQMGRSGRLSHVFDATGDDGMGITVEAWVKLGASTKGGTIFEKNRWRHAPQYRLRIDNDRRPVWMHSWGTGNHTYEVVVGHPLPVGEWMHLAGSTEFNGTEMQIRLHVNGTLAGHTHAKRRPIEAGFTAIMIGGMYDPGPANILSDVSIDELLVHRRMVPPSELGWFKGSRRTALAKALAAGMIPAAAEDWAGFTPISLSKVANVGLQNESGNDLRSLLPGDWMMASVPIRIIEPTENDGKAVVKLKGNHSTTMPVRLRANFAPFRIERMHFLHSAGHTGRGKGNPILTYIVTYEDGTQTHIECRNKMEIANWWHLKPIENAQVAWSGSNLATSKVQVYLFTWQNPQPINSIRSIEMVGDHNATPTILAITALNMP